MNTQKKIACIGAGNMGRALMAGAAKIAGGENIIFTDHSPAKAEAAAKLVGGKSCAKNADAVHESDIVFFAVKPYAVFDAITETQNAFSKEKIAVSMAAGFTLCELCDSFDITEENLPSIIRVMPNTPALVGKGVIAIAFEDYMGRAYASADAANAVQKLLAASGVCDIVNENHIDAITALSGCGPAFCCLFLEALADGGVFAGLSRSTALKYAALTMEGTAKMLLETGKHPGILKDEVASPGGATIAGLAALENKAMRGAVLSAVRASFASLVKD